MTSNEEGIVDAEAYADMFPWLVFLVIDRKSGLGVAWAGGGALACSAALVGWSYLRGRHPLVPRVGMVLFAAFLVSGLAWQSWNTQVSLPRALVIVSLSVLAFASLRFTPLSETYTVPLVAPAVREDPRFARVNVEITIAWGVGSFAVAVATGTTALLAGAVAFTFLDWVTPIVLAAATILWCTRRWELFRLAVDSVVIGHKPADAGIPLSRDGGALGHYGGQSARRAVPLDHAGRQGGTDEGRGTGDGSSGAVIHRLPIRERNG